MHPVKALRLVSAMGGSSTRVRLVACEPATFGDEDDVTVALSHPVAAAIEPAISLVDELIVTLSKEASRA
jgi:hydrogenase maturation protease